MGSPAPSLARRIWHHVYSRMLTGVLFVVPVALTLWVLRLLYALLDGPLRSLLNAILTPTVGWGLPPGVGLVLTLLLLYGTGVLAANVFGRQILHFWEGLLTRLPLVKNIYTAAKQVIEMISLPQKAAFKRVVLIEFPRPGLWIVGFQTGTMTNQDGKIYHAVFVPTTPNPTSGYLELVPAEQVRATSLTVEEGIKMIVSGGILSPERIELRTEIK